MPSTTCHTITSTTTVPLVARRADDARRQLRTGAPMLAQLLVYGAGRLRRLALHLTPCEAIAVDRLAHAMADVGLMADCLHSDLHPTEGR